MTYAISVIYNVTAQDEVEARELAIDELPAGATIACVVEMRSEKAA